MLCAGCSALSWHTEDGKHLWGRNLDFNRLAEGTMVTFFPTGTIYRIFGTEAPSGTQEIRRTARYAAAGMGLYPTSGIAILYEGINSQGLMGGQLYYRTLAHYSAHCRPGTTPIQPPFLVYHLLAQCATVEEVVQVLRKELTLVDRPFWGTVPPLHWTFSDRTGESIVVEPDEDGLHIHRSAIGVMTNSPDYRWHRLNLLNYAGIRDLDHDGLCICGDSLTQCFSGSGAQGLPGDWSSPARFVRLALLKSTACQARTKPAASPPCSTCFKVRPSHWVWFGSVNPDTLPSRIPALFPLTTRSTRPSCAPNPCAIIGPPMKISACSASISITCRIGISRCNSPWEGNRISCT